jgi:transcription initiation factor TFIID TATA-box-binding protein
VIVSSRLSSHIDVEKISTTLPHSEYEPEVFPGLIYRRENPKATVVMFSSGKITAIGARSVREGKQAIIATVKELGLAGCLATITTENVVASADLGLEMDLERFAADAHSFGQVVYEPQQFPGLILRNKSMAFLLFASGKINCAGFKSESGALTGIRKLAANLSRHGYLRESHETLNVLGTHTHGIRNGD